MLIKHIKIIKFDSTHSHTVSCFPSNNDKNNADKAALRAKRKRKRKKKVDYIGPHVNCGVHLFQYKLNAFTQKLRFHPLCTEPKIWSRHLHYQVVGVVFVEYIFHLMFVVRIFFVCYLPSAVFLFQRIFKNAQKNCQSLMGNVVFFISVYANLSVISRQKKIVMFATVFLVTSPSFIHSFILILFLM